MYSANKMNLKAFEDISQKASNIAAQQKIAQGVQENGFGEMGNMFMGVNLSQVTGAYGEPLQPSHSDVKPTIFEEKIEQVKKLKELVDDSILTEEEFNKKKKEILDL